MIPSRQTNYHVPELETLRKFRDLLTKEHHAERNYRISHQVIECLMFIKINEAWLRYAIEHKKSDASIYTYPADMQKQVIRAPNNMSFHIISYDSADDGIQEYQALVSDVEAGITKIQDNPHLVRMFIRLIKDSDAACMEDRLTDCRPFLIDPSLPRLRDLFLEYQDNLDKKKINLEDDTRVFRHFYHFFEGKLGEHVLHDTNNIEVDITWPILRDYYALCYGGFDQSIIKKQKEDALALAQDGQLRLIFKKYSTAEVYWHWLLLFGTEVISETLSEQDITEEPDGCYGLTLSQDAFTCLIEKLPKGDRLVPIESLDLLLANLAKAAAGDDVDTVVGILEQYPFLMSTNFKKSSVLIYALIENKTTLLQALLERTSVDICDAFYVNEERIIAIEFATRDDRVSAETLKIALLFAEKHKEKIFGHLLLVCCELGYDEKFAVIFDRAHLYVNAIFNEKIPLLTFAVGKKRTNMVALLMQSPHLKVNKHDSDEQNALSYAVANGPREIVELLLTAPEINLSVESALYGDLIRAAQKTQLATLEAGLAEFKIIRRDAVRSKVEAERVRLTCYDEMAPSALREEWARTHQQSYSDENPTPEKIDLDVADDAELLRIRGVLKAAQLKRFEARLAPYEKVPSYQQYCRNLHRVPSDETYLEYLRDVYVLYKRQDCEALLTDPERRAVKARLLWQEMVSDIERENVEYCEQNDIRFQVIARLKSVINDVDYERLLDDLIEFIQINTIITHAFRPQRIFPDNFKQHHLQNIWETYNSGRETYETRYFNGLRSDIKKRFLAEKRVRPRYGALYFTDKNTPAAGLRDWGNSFLVFKDIIKQNALLVAGNPTMLARQDAKLCTLAHPEILLRHCPLPTLKALVTRHYYGAFPSRDYQQSFNPYDGGYMVALLPEIDFVNPDFVEHVHMSAYDHHFNAVHKLSLNSIGIRVSNARVAPYAVYQDEIRTACRENQLQTVDTLLSAHPSLKLTVDHAGFGLTHIAAHQGHHKLLALLEKHHCRLVDPHYRPSILEIAITQNRVKASRFCLQRLSALRQMTPSALLEERRVPEQVDTPVSLAAKSGAIDTLKICLEYDIDVNAKTLKNKSLLELAHDGGHRETVSLLVEHHADPNVLLNTETSRSDSILLDEHSELASAIEDNNEEIIARYLTYHPNWSMVPLTKEGLSAIDLALLYRHEARFMMLCDFALEQTDLSKDDLITRARPQPIDNIVQFTIYHHLDNCYDYLSKFEFDVTLTDSEQNAPLHAAILCEKNNLTARLLEAHADPSQKDKHGLAPYQLTHHNSKAIQNPLLGHRLLIHDAVMKNNSRTLKKYADMHAAWLTKVPIHEGKTALTLSAVTLSLDAFRALYAALDCHHIDANGQSALETATEAGRLEMVIFLLSLDPQDLDKALAIAQDKGHVVIAEAIARKQLPRYIAETEKRPSQSRWAGFFVYTKEQKLAAANKVMDVLSRNSQADELRSFQGELSQGQLGRIRSALRL